MRSSRRALCALAALLFAARAGAAEPLERILADVDSEAVLLSEVKVVEEVKGLSRERALESAIEARLMQREAARLPQAALSASEAESACTDLKQKAPGVTDEAALCALARSEAQILKYVAFRFTGADLDGQIEAWVRELRVASTIRYNAP
jgi:hypothetical protein